MKARILWIEGKRAENPSFIPGLRKKDYQIEVVPTSGAALDTLFAFDPDLVVINAASLRSSGKRTCRDLRARSPQLPLVVITRDEASNSQDLGANVVLHLPFTLRKLMNRIVPLLPADESQQIHVGPIRLDLGMKKVRCRGNEARLTPRLVRLLQILMEHPGEVQPRTELFREVWNTDYTGDTRTLDVHISWLREAIEENPRHPRFIKTIRGVGYRLDI